MAILSKIVRLHLVKKVNWSVETKKITQVGLSVKITQEDIVSRFHVFFQRREAYTNILTHSPTKKKNPAPCK